MTNSSYIEESVRIPSGTLSLEGILAYPEEGDPTECVLVLAPHPHMGGNMDNNIVRHVARRAAQEGAATLRFNYRGVGGSTIHLPPDESLFDHWSEMERDKRYEEILPDALSALTTLVAAVPAATQVNVVGYSLGAILAGMVASEVQDRGALDRSVTRVVGISPPTKRASLSAYAGVRAPKLFMAGDRDFAFDKAAFEREMAELPGEKLFVELPGGDHFFRQEEERVYATLCHFISETCGRGDCARN